MPVHKKDLSELVHAGIISTETADAIAAYYQIRKQHSANPMLTIFGALGGVLVGLGLILIFAHNWDNFSRITKTVLAFTPLVLSQVFAAYCIVKSKARAFRETAAVLIFFSVGASISLISQIYNIEGDLPQFLFTWAILCTPIMYLLRSSAAAILHIIIITAYAESKAFIGYQSPKPYLYLPLFACIIPYYYNRIKEDALGRITLTLHIIITLSLVIVSPAFFLFHESGSFTIILFALFYGLMYQTGKLPGFGRVYRIFGACGLIVIMVMCSFRETWSSMHTYIAPVAYGAVAAVMMACVLTFTYHNYRKKEIDPVQFIPLVLSAVYLVSLVSNGLAAILVNLLVLATGLWYVKKGIDEVKYLTVNFGILTIAILAGCRFFDTNISFVIRGLLFVGVGAGFFVVNYLVSKRKQYLNN